MTGLNLRREPASEAYLSWLTGMLKAMPWEVRQAFLLRKQRELSHDQIAVEMGITVERVRELLYESVAHLASSGGSPPV